MKKIASMILTCLMLISIMATNVISSSELPFNDVSHNTWYYDEVKTAYNKGIMDGKSNNIFDPEGQTTRAEFVKVLCCMSGDTYLNKGSYLTFTDIESDKWYVDYVGWGVENEIVKGFPGNKFGPNDPVTREEMAVFIERFVKYLNVELQSSPQINAFKDTNEISSFAADAVEIMRLSGIITGTEKGEFNPKDNTSRAEIATVVTRLLSVLNIDRKNFDIQKAFSYGEKSEDIKLNYRLYLPENYSEDKEYPLLVYLHGCESEGVDNKSQLKYLSSFFANSSSPVFDSIVLAPESPTSWRNSQIKQLVKLIDKINEEYSTDLNRQYFVGPDAGGYGVWRLMYLYPEKVSAAIVVGAPTVTFITYVEKVPPVTLPNPDTFNDEMLNIPIYMIYDNDDDSYYSEYVDDLKGALLEYKADNIILKTTDGYGSAISNNYVTETDISVLEWMYSKSNQ